MLFKYIVALCSYFFIIFILLNTLASDHIENKIAQNKATSIYNESQLMAEYYTKVTNSISYNPSNSTIMDTLYHELELFSVANEIKIWILTPDGTLIYDTEGLYRDNKSININKENSNLLQNTTNFHVNLEPYIKEDSIAVVSTILDNYTKRAYILQFLSYDTINKESISINTTINVILVLLMVVMLAFLIALYINNIRPLRKLTYAAKRYASGEFDYSPGIKRHDEYGELQNALAYIALELSSLDEYQKKFVANISHDFRSPLTSIKGYAEAMIDGTIPYENQGKYLEIIRFETERLNKLTSNLLTLNSFENNGIILDIASFDINKTIRQTGATFEGICKTKKITLSLDFAEQSIYVDADISKIQQVLYNLLDNAIKFSHSNSHIDITTKIKNEKVFITIKDYGIGIPKESIKKVWERFYKTDASRGKDKKGTGLGLSIVKDIINSHNENINVISTEGVGTEFIFSLPRTED